MKTERIAADKVAVEFSEVKLLLVADDLNQLAVLIECLKTEDSTLNVVTATGESDAISRLAQHRGKLGAIICSLTAEKKSIELVKVVRSLRIAVPFFILAAQRNFAETAALKAGANAVHYKPVRISKLVAEIKQALLDSKLG